MIPQQLYDIFIRFEERSADLYLEMSVRFLRDVEVSWFWVEMAMEEKQHAGMLQYCKETGTYSTPLPVTDQIQNLAALFKELGNRLAVPALELDEAFEIAVALESSEINQVYRNLTSNVDGPSYVIRKKIDLSVANHFTKLKEAATRFRVSARVQQKLEHMVAAQAAD